MPLVTITDVKALAIVLPTLAIIATAGRLCLRMRSRIFATDDACATLSMVALIVFSIGTFISLGPTDRGTTIGLFYALAQLYYLVLWSARLSILFSLVQPTSSAITRRSIYAIALAFTSCWAFLFAQVFYVCEKAPSWKESSVPKCPLGTGVAIAQLTTGVAVNCILLIFPVVSLRQSTTTRHQRIQYILITATAAAATVVNLVHGYFNLRVGGLKESITAIVELSLTLLACNATVVGLVVWRLVRPPTPIDRWEMCGTPSFHGLSPVFSSDTLKTIHLSPLSGTQVSYEPGGKTPFRRSPSPLWYQDGSGVHITEEKVSVLHFPTPAVVRR